MERGNYQPNLFDNIFGLRLEGIATFFGNQKKKNLKYKLEDPISFRQLVGNYDGTGPLYLTGYQTSLKYECGLFMCYFIGLSYLRQKYPKKYNSIRVYFDEQDFLFLSEGLKNILSIAAERGLDSIYFENLPRSIILKVCKKTLEQSHLGFMKEYERACNILDIPKNHIIITISDYKIMKKKSYGVWYSKIKEQD